MEDEILIELFKEKIAKDKEFRLKVFGNSMKPFIKDGDIIGVKKVDYKGISIGDVILYYVDKKVFAHRILYKRRRDGGEFLIVKGDFVGSFDFKVQPEQVLGKVVKIEKKEREIRLENKGAKAYNYLILLYSLMFSMIREWGSRIIKKSKIKNKVSK